MKQDPRQPLEYMARTRAYYQALGFDTPYRWAQFSDVPFQRLSKSLEECDVALVTTAAPYQPEAGDQGPGAAYNAKAKFYKVYELPSDPIPDLRISHVGIDRTHTSMADPNTWLPLSAMLLAREAGRIGRVSRSVYGLPTNRSHRVSQEQDCPDLVARLAQAGADAVILVANCPVCHQSCSFAARALEAAGIPTVLMGCARDIVEHVGVPRFVFSDFPLGNAAGKPHDLSSQKACLELALQTLDTARRPRATVVNPEDWSADHSWKSDYSNPENLTAAQLAEAAERFHANKAVAHARRDATAVS